MIDLFKDFALTDFIDILIVAVFVYWILILIRGTRAVQVLLGLGLLFLLYGVSHILNLRTLNWVLGSFVGSLIIIIVILFQSEIRRALVRLGRASLVPSSSAYEQGYDPDKMIEELVRGCATLVNRRLGALIVVERNVGLDDYIEDGVRIDSNVTKEIITSIFLPTSPIHDGAIIIRKGVILAAGCFLPLATNLELDKDLGTRHRAALGISQESDSATIVVSEERQEISLVAEEKIHFNLDSESLTERLRELLL